MKATRAPWFSHGLVLVAVYFFLATAAAVKIAVHEAESSRLISRIAALEDLNGVVAIDQYQGEKRLGFVMSSVLRLVNPSGTTAAQVAAGQREVVAMTADLQHEFIGSLESSLVLIALSTLFLIAALAPETNAAAAAEKRIYALLSVSVIFFVIGISLPVLTAVVRGEHRIIGGFIIQTASKGIISTVVTLMRSGNWVIGLLLAGFSIGIPIFKGGSVLVALSLPNGRARATVGKWLEAIGRWSLTDVLVAAILLSCFSLNAFKEEDGGVFAAPRFAFGFFIAYCVLASFTSHLLKRAVVIAPGDPPSAARAGANATLLIVAAGAGAATGFYGLAHANYAREAAESSVVKLIRSHTSLIDETYHVAAGQPRTILIAVPFPGTLSVDVKGPGQTPIGVVFERDPGAFAGRKSRPPAPLSAFPEEQTTAYLHTGKIAVGSYRLILSDRRPPGVFGSSPAVAVRVGLDP
jgi:hypothetical protein